MEPYMTIPTVNQAPKQIVELPGERIAGATQLLDTSGNVIGTAANPLATQPTGGNNGVDYSANAPSLSGLSLLATIPANTGRLGFFIQAQGTAQLTVAFDDTAGSLTPTIVVLQGASANGGQGASVDMGGVPHTGRIRIFSTSTSAPMAARAW
jgi:hypothetical protein